MRRPASNRTIEGATDATEWLQKHQALVPRLRRLFMAYYKECGRNFPWRHVQDPYKLLVAEMLLQKTAVKPMVRVWASFVEQFPDAKTLSLAPLEKIEAAIRPLGLAKRARRLHALASMIVQQAGGQLASDAAFLRLLPGVGSYTSAAIRSFAFNIRAAAIDINAARVYARIGGFAPNTLRQGLAFAEVVGERLVTRDAHREINYGVLDLAAQVCKPIPLCLECPALKLCAYGQQRVNTEGM
jgi:A/G-specific adenine glycosylase